jgi:hypothetical protein
VIVDPAVWKQPDMRVMLAARDIRCGVPGTHRPRDQPAADSRSDRPVTAGGRGILGERRVIAYEVLERIAEGLGVPREYMGMSWGGENGAPGAYPGEVTPEGVSAEMLHRHLLALGATAAFGATIKGLGELLDLPYQASAPLPSRVFAVHVGRCATHSATRSGRKRLPARTHGSAARRRRPPLGYSRFRVPNRSSGP